MKMDVGRAAVTTGEGGAPFYRGEAVGMRTVGASARPTALNGTREWILEWEVETVGRGGGRVAVAFHFSMGGRGQGGSTTGRAVVGEWRHCLRASAEVEDNGNHNLCSHFRVEETVSMWVQSLVGQQACWARVVTGPTHSGG
jgi:hypothetical protein